MNQNKILKQALVFAVILLSSSVFAQTIKNPSTLTTTHKNILFDGFNDNSPWYVDLPQLSTMKEEQMLTFIFINEGQGYLFLNQNDKNSGKVRFSGYHDYPFLGTSTISGPLYLFGVVRLIALPSANIWSVIGEGWGI